MKPFAELIAAVIHGPAEAAADSWNELDSIVGGLARNERSDLLRLSLKDMKILGPVDAAIAETLEGLLCDLYHAAESEQAGVTVSQDAAGEIHIDFSESDLSDALSGRLLVDQAFRKEFTDNLLDDRAPIERSFDELEPAIARGPSIEEMFEEMKR